MKRFYRRLLGLATFVVLVSPSPAWTRTTSATANTFLPAIDGSPYFTLYGSQTIMPWRYQVGIYLNYASDPLEVGVAGVPRADIVSHLLMADVFGAVGITDWFHLGLNIPVALFERVDSGPLIGAGATLAGTFDTVARMGDLRFETKFRLLDIDRHHVGVAVMPYLLIPTGSGSRVIGNNSFAGGAKAIVDVNIKNRVQISANLGYLARDKATIFGTIQDDAFTYGLGVNIKTINPWMDIITEIYGATNVGDFFARQSELPLEIDGGFRFFLPKPEGLAITAGAGVGLTFGYGTPDYRAFLGLTYPNPKRVELPIPPPPPPVEAPQVEEKKIIAKKIHFEFDKAVIRPISFRILDGIVDLLKENSSIRKVRVEGHCDSKGTDAYNMRLSQRRANAVRDYLIAHGISGDRLVAVGYGESRPVDTNDTPEGRARNRRVEFTILEQ